MQLYVLGPGYGLPSIDAECVAAVALLRVHGVEGWQLLPTHDHSRLVPYLIHGEQVLQGFKSIASYLQSADVSDACIAAATSDSHRPDSTAITSFVQTNAQPLLDISLYVSYENYSATRSAFTKILPWYANYIIPPRRRTASRQRTEHLGVSSIDVDDVHEDLSNRPSSFDVGKEAKFEADTQKRASLLLPRKNTVRSLLQTPQHSAMFKLHALADNFFGPLQDMLGKEQYFSAPDRPLATDCLVYGYLSLMLYPKLPHDWLAKTMRRKYTKLVAFTEHMHDSLDLNTDVDQVMSLAKCKTEAELGSRKAALSLTLPWAQPQASAFSDMATTVLFDLATRVPFVGLCRVEVVSASSRRASFWSNPYLPAALATTSTSLGLLAYYAFKSGLLVWPHGEQLQIFGRKRFADYGHLGAALAGMSLLAQTGTNDTILHPQDGYDKLGRVEVEVETDLER